MICLQEENKGGHDKMSDKNKYKLRQSVVASAINLVIVVKFRFCNKHDYPTTERQLGQYYVSLLLCASAISPGIIVESCYCNRIFPSFHKTDRSDISTNVVDIYLCINIMLS